jgi:Flp pilus assembly protein TadD
MNAAESIAMAQRQIESGEFAQALATLGAVLARDAREFRAHTLRGVALSMLGEHACAIEAGRVALELRPDDPRLRAYFGKLLIDAGRARDAIPDLEAQCAKHPGEELLWLRLCEAQLIAGFGADAARSAERGLAAHPRSLALLLQSAGAAMAMGHADRAIVHLRSAATKAPGNFDILSQLAGALNYVPGVAPAEVLRTHREYGRALAQRLGASGIPSAPLEVDPARPLRIGFVSNDLGGHSVVRFLEPILDHLDRAKFTIVCYATATNEDATTRRLKSKPITWRRVSAKNLEQLVQCVRGDAIDILFDLGGHTASHRLPLFHARAAPVQATYLAYPNTTGVAGIDFRIVDSRTDPVGSESLCTERLIRLDPCFVCYRADADRPAPRARAAGASPTFGSFNRLLKINEPLLRLWGRVLEASPASTLVLKSWDLASPQVIDDLRARWRAIGQDADRLRVLHAAPSTREHLALYHEIDVALDTFPYCGTTTTCEALSMGVPVVTRAGDVHASRVGASLLAAAGLPELVAASDDEYVRIAADLSRDRDRLARWRAELPARFAASPACDEPGFARAFERVLGEMWRSRATPRGS